MNDHRCHKCTILFCLTISCCLSYKVTEGQRKYFEFNNAEAIRLTAKRIESLCSREWYVSRIEYKERERNYDHHTYQSIRYNKDGTYTFGREKGSWELIYGKYLRHEADEVHRNYVGLAGIYSVLAMSDTAVIITKVLTSSGDMKRTLHLSTKQIKPLRWQSDSTYYKPTSGTLHPSYGYYSRPSFSPEELDSLSYQNMELLQSDGYNISEEGILRIEARDSTYFVRLKIDMPDEFIKVFHQDELVEGFPPSWRRFTPSVEDITTINKRLSAFLHDVFREHDVIADVSISDQFKQYAGFRDDQGQSFIYVTCFCDYHRDWKVRLITRDGSQLCFFFVKYNVITGEFHDLILN
jgi:hypothetical protein